MKDQLRPGQRLVDYAYMVEKVKASGRIPPIEQWLWNLSQEEFDKAMKWSPE